MGIQCAIFERESIQLTNWSNEIAGYLVGYTFSLFILYSLAPILFRLSSAMFYNLSLLTSGMIPFSGGWGSLSFRCGAFCFYCVRVCVLDLTFWFGGSVFMFVDWGLWVVFVMLAFAVWLVPGVCVTP